MDFSSLLNRYITELDCSAKDLAEASGISAAAISRYRAGERTPDPDSKQLRMLASGIAALSAGSLSEQAVHEEFAASISGISIDYDTFLSNLSALLETLSVNNNEVARALSFDPSYISRILTGQRRPADLQAFVTGVSRFAVQRSEAGDLNGALQALIGASLHNAPDEDARAQAVATWLGTNYAPIHDPISSFLKKLDEFNLDDFIRAIHFDEMKVPTTPIQLPTTKTYTGIREMMECEIDFLKAAVLSKSSASVIMYSDMPMEEMAADPEFPRKWMYGMAMMLKKGLHLHMIHDTNRPLPEMMLGLEGWIPMYMTGQISPYYFTGADNSVFNHLLKVAGTVAMQGEAIHEHQGEGRYILTKNRDEVRYYRKRAERMLEQARPLMRIITAANADKLQSFLEESMELECRRRVIMSTPPIGSIPAGLLERMLERNNVAETDRTAIRAFAAQRAEELEELLDGNEIRLEFPNLTREEFDAYPPTLDLSGLFFEDSVSYSYSEYIEHLTALQSFIAPHEQCALIIDNNQAFRNVQITICEGHHVLVSKNKGPVIHFVIEHPAMVSAFERFTAPVRD
ncbi:MAG: helix-turn-helix transcriptional regulator [Eggerthellaceae bacterium]|nr:helix-turn-helix transcriptional regulator [Eggerthellaceae bacterium]